MQINFLLAVTNPFVTEKKRFNANKGKLLPRHGTVRDVHSMIGDSVGNVKASKETGVKIASVLWDSHREEKVKTMKSDYYFYSVEELREFLFF